MDTMRIISKARLGEFWRKDRAAERPLRRWYEVVKESRWKTLADVWRAFPHADMVRVGSGKTVTIFNVAGNNYRLIAAIHFDRQRVFVLLVMTHAEYDRAKWKDEL